MMNKKNVADKVAEKVLSELRRQGALDSSAEVKVIKDQQNESEDIELEREIHNDLLSTMISQLFLDYAKDNREEAFAILDQWEERSLNEVEVLKGQFEKVSNFIPGTSGVKFMSECGFDPEKEAQLIKAIAEVPRASMGGSKKGAFNELLDQLKAEREELEEIEESIKRRVVQNNFVPHRDEKGRFAKVENATNPAAKFQRENS